MLAKLFYVGRRPTGTPTFSHQILELVGRFVPGSGHCLSRDCGGAIVRAGGIVAWVCAVVLSSKY